ncbi:hypothetical protein IKP13_05390 [bacterium]|nr:hypothetical protein [bacterium]
MEKEKKSFLKVGDRIHCRSWKDLKSSAFQMSAEGYGVSIIGFGDMSENVLTVTAVPGVRDCESCKHKIAGLCEKWKCEYERAVIV